MINDVRSFRVGPMNKRSRIKQKNLLIMSKFTSNNSEKNAGITTGYRSRFATFQFEEFRLLEMAKLKKKNDGWCVLDCRIKGQPRHVCRTSVNETIDAGRSHSITNYSNQSGFSTLKIWAISSHWFLQKSQNNQIRWITHASGESVRSPTAAKCGLVIHSLPMQHWTRRQN